jgi:hypothetical protein
MVYPAGQGAELSPVIEQDGSISSLTIVAAGSGYTHAEITITSPSQCQPPDYNAGSDDGPGFNWNPYIVEVPPEPLSPPASASMTVQEAIDDVTKCNCDCWNL